MGKIARIKPFTTGRKTFLCNKRDRLPLLGYSTSKGADHELMYRCMIRAINRGVYFLDTAYSHLCETVVGRVLEKCWENGYKRDDFFIITKLPAIGNRQADVKKFLTKSLTNLGVDQVDIYLIESPVGLLGKNDTDVDPRDEEGNSVLDMSTDLIQVWYGMEEQYYSGLARFIGVCNFNVEQISRIYNNSRMRPCFAMMDINAYNQRRVERKWMMDNFIDPLAILPMGNPNFHPVPGWPHLLKHPKVLYLSYKYSVSTDVITIKYVVQNDIITFFQTESVLRVSNILESYHRFQLGRNSFNQLQELDMDGAAQLKNFAEYQGCEHHPEFPFSYNIKKYGNKGGLWKTSKVLNPVGPDDEFLNYVLPSPPLQYSDDSSEDLNKSTGFVKYKSLLLPEPSCSSKDTEKIFQRLFAPIGTTTTMESKVNKNLQTFSGSISSAPNTKLKSILTNKKQKAKNQNATQRKMKKKGITPCCQRDYQETKDNVCDYSNTQDLKAKETVAMALKVASLSRRWSKPH